MAFQCKSMKIASFPNTFLQMCLRILLEPKNPFIDNHSGRLYLKPNHIFIKKKKKFTLPFLKTCRIKPYQKIKRPFSAVCVSWKNSSHTYIVKANATDILPTCPVHKTNTSEHQLNGIQSPCSCSQKNWDFIPILQLLLTM